MEPMIGEVRMFGGNFAPRAWALCEGQLLAINSNQALFSILGTTYGGDGRTTFALPDLRGRVAIAPGNGPGLSDKRLGEKGGIENVTLNTTQIPAHGHNLITGSIQVGNEGKGSASSETASGNFIGNVPGGFRSTGGGGNLANGSIQGNSANTGGNLSHNNMQPYLAVNYIIALQGIFPSRN